MKTIMKNVWTTIKTIIVYLLMAGGAWYFVDELRIGINPDFAAYVMLALGCCKISMIWWKYIVLRWVAQVTEKTNG